MKPYYEKDGITIYHGDCREILPTLQFDALITDPPYGMNSTDAQMTGGVKKWGLWSEKGKETSRSVPLKWDNEAPEIVSSFPILANQVVVWGGNFFSLPVSRSWLVWNKIIRNFSSSVCELAWTNLAAPIDAFDYSHGQLATEGKSHPTQKPLPLMKWCIGKTSGETILDPFMGSGTTLVAAKNLGRKAIGIEIEEKYCEIAAKRLSQDVLDFVKPPEYATENLF